MDDYYMQEETKKIISGFNYTLENRLDDLNFTIYCDDIFDWMYVEEIDMLLQLMCCITN